LHAFLTIAAAFLNPLLADAGGQVIVPDSGPTWTLAGACTAFLLALIWALKVLVVSGKDAGRTLYNQIVVPFATSQIALMESLRSAQVTNAASLESLAASTDAIRVEIHDLRSQWKTAAHCPVNTGGKP
jgi:hypothetical protein